MLCVIVIGEELDNKTNRSATEFQNLSSQTKSAKLLYIVKNRMQQRKRKGFVLKKPNACRPIGILLHFLTILMFSFEEEWLFYLHKNDL